MNGTVSLTGGTLGDGGHTINVGTAWVTTSGLFTTTGTVNFLPGNQTISGSTVFNNLSKSAAGGNALTFQAAATQTIDGTLTLLGTGIGNDLSLASSTGGTAFSLHAAGGSDLAYLNVKDSTAATTSLTALSSNNQGNNTNWTFFNPTATLTWTTSPTPTMTPTPSVQPTVCGSVPIINTVAGDGLSGYNNDGNPATTENINNPIGIAFDSAGNAITCRRHAQQPHPQGQHHRHHHHHRRAPWRQRATRATATRPPGPP